MVLNLNLKRNDKRPQPLDVPVQTMVLAGHIVPFREQTGARVFQCLLKVTRAFHHCILLLPCQYDQPVRVPGCCPASLARDPVGRPFCRFFFCVLGFLSNSNLDPVTRHCRRSTEVVNGKHSNDSNIDSNSLCFGICRAGSNPVSVVSFCAVEDQIPRLCCFFLPCSVSRWGRVVLDFSQSFSDRF